MLEKLLKLDTFKQWFEKINNAITKTNTLDESFSKFQTDSKTNFDSNAWSKKPHNYGVTPISLKQVNKGTSLAYIKEYGDEQFIINKVDLSGTNTKYILRNDKYHFMVNFDGTTLSDKIQIANYDEVVSLTRDEDVGGYKTLTNKLTVTGADILPFGSWRESIKFTGGHSSINLNENIGIGLHDINRIFYWIDHKNLRYIASLNYENGSLAIPLATAELTLGTVKVKEELSKKLNTANLVINTGTITHGGTIPLPSDFTVAQCKFFVSPYLTNPNWSVWDINEDGSHMQFRMQCSVDGNRVVTASLWVNDSRIHFPGSANYIIIGIK